MPFSAAAAAAAVLLLLLFLVAAAVAAPVVLAAAAADVAAGFAVAAAAADCCRFVAAHLDGIALSTDVNGLGVGQTCSNKSTVDPNQYSCAAETTCRSKPHTLAGQALQR